MPETTQTFNGGAAPMSQGAPPPDFAASFGESPDKPIDGGAAQATPTHTESLANADLKGTESVGEIPKGGIVRAKA